MQTVKMGKRGTILLPASFRKQLGLSGGSLLVTEAKDGEIHLRPALPCEPERWTPERTAYFMLNNCVTQEEWDAMVPDVVAMGLDPNRIEGIEPAHRESLPTDLEWDRRTAKAIAVNEVKTLSA